MPVCGKEAKWCSCDHNCGDILYTLWWGGEHWRVGGVSAMSLFGALGVVIVQETFLVLIRFRSCSTSDWSILPSWRSGNASHLYAPPLDSHMIMRRSLVQFWVKARKNPLAKQVLQSFFPSGVVGRSIFALGIVGQYPAPAAYPGTCPLCEGLR